MSVIPAGNIFGRAIFMATMMLAWIRKESEIALARVEAPAPSWCYSLPFALPGTSQKPYFRKKRYASAPCFLASRLNKARSTSDS